MDRKASAILGISPGTRYLELAVVDNTGLRDWRIKVFRGTYTSQEAERILEAINAIIDRFNPTALAVKRVHTSRSSLALQNLTSSIEKLASSRALHLHVGVTPLNRTGS